ncbi:LTA synthase family protein [Paenibacillus sp. GYB006]|uniref:LTA synthase family protein n=1 Tax=Paenibacillus sp. GYB006 TaxID=2994394 RepID=UPI002F96CA79
MSNTNKIRSINKGKAIIFIVMLIIPFLSLLLMEWSVKGTLAEFFSWMTENKTSLAMNYVIHLSLFLFIISISSFKIGIVIYVPFILIFTSIHFYKLEFLNEPFFPWDLLFAKQLTNLLPAMIKEINVTLLFFMMVIFFLAVFFIIKLVPKIRLSMIFRAITIIISSFVILTISFNTKFNFSKNLLSDLGIENMVWDQSSNYEKNGVLLSFTLNVPNSIVLAPENYNREKILSIVDKINPQQSENANIDNEKITPNIIYVMNEAFWDPTIIKNIKFSQDPLPFIHSVSSKTNYFSGWLISPQFGGGTSNVEFEALTGLSMKYLPEGSMPYQQYINRDFPSLPSNLKKYGYKTLAIHSYVEWFWNRKNVYSHFQFDKFISEGDFKEPERRGLYISDKDVSRKILNEIEESKEPAFVYAITMQNHSPYNYDAKYDSSFNVQGEIGVDAKEALEIYSQGIKEAEDSLKYLLDNLEEPSLVVYFGDHLPNLGANVYNQLDFGAEDSLENERLHKSTPLLIWRNFGLEVNQDININGISPTFLLPYIYELTGLEKPKYYEFLSSINNKYSAISKTININAEGENKREIDSITEEDYKLIQYDLLFGKEYSKNYLFN